MYDSGDGVPVELPRSIAYFRRAGALGDGPSQMQLGLDYSTGRGVKQDNVEGLMWYMLALPRLEGKDRETVEIAGRLVAAQMTEDQRNEANYRAAAFYEKKR
jgi:TPR repeat protein